MLLTKWTMNKVTRSNIVPYDKTVYDFGNELKIILANTMYAYIYV